MADNNNNANNNVGLPIYSKQQVDAMMSDIKTILLPQIRAEIEQRAKKTAMSDALAGKVNVGTYNALQSRVANIESLVGNAQTPDADTIINKVVELIDFFSGIAESETLAGMMASLRQEITALIPAIEDFHEAVATLASAPDATTLTYTRNGQTYAYKIGDEVRVADAEATETGGYKFYKLYDIKGSGANHEAVWAESGTGGGSASVMGTIIVPLEAYVNDAKTSGAELVGVVVTLTNTTDTETVDTHTIASGESSVTFSGLTPMKDYSVSVTAVTGYSQPSAKSVTNLGIAEVKTLTAFQYEADEYTVAITSNQGAGDTGVSGGKVIYDNTEYADGATFKVAKGTISVTAKAVTGYRCTEADGDLVTSNKTITATYKTEILTVTITKDQGDGDISQCNVVVTGGGSTLGTLTNGQSLKIAYGVNYTLTPSAAPLGYDDPGAVTKDWADTPTKTVTITYEESKGVDLGLPSGILWAAQNVGATNPEDAGDYFSWGNVDGHAAGSGYDFSQANYANTDGATLTGDIPQTAEFDAAMANMGAPWMMPSKELFKELFDNTDTEWTTINGVAGRKYMKKSDHSVFVFLPAAGFYENTTRSGVGANGNYWSITQYSTTEGYYPGFNTNGSYDTNHVTKILGMPTRGVRYPNTIKIHLTSTDNGSVSGVKIKVSNSSVILNVATNSNGDAVFSLPNGTFTIESSTHALSVRTMVVSGNTAINANSTSVIGNWIFERKGGLYDASQWAAAKQAGTVSDDDVIGIAILTEDHKELVALENLGIKTYYNSNTAPSGVTGITNQTQAEADYSGESKTLLLMNTYGSDSTYFAGAARNYTFGNGSKGYLPALGELILCFDNSTEIDTLLAACGKSSLPTDKSCATSTYYGLESSNPYFWLRRLGSNTWRDVLTASYYCLPFTQWKPISTRLHFTATDESSVAGMVLEITDGNGNSTYVKTGADGDAYLSLDDGTYTVVAFSHSLSVNTFTVSGLGTVVNISATKKEYVDLGLPSGIKWATCNLGASSPTESGDYFSWGNIVGHAKDSGYSFDQTTYNSTPGSSLMASISSSDASHDAALAIKGSPWRMPTKEDFQELYDNTDTEWTSINGVAGRKFMKKSDHSVYVFFPASGYYDGTSLNSRGSFGNYWSSSYYYNTNAYYLGFSCSDVNPQINYVRNLGFSVRAVQ